MRAVANFGGNICFRPRCLYAPRTDDEVLRILNDHRDGAIRVVGAGHSWNPGIESTDALIDLKHICHVHVDGDSTRVTVGAGVRIGALLKHLSQRGLTLPSLGLIDRQTIAGAVATGTHGSGRHSMSHYVEAMRIACYGADGGAKVRTVGSGTLLRAARCSVGALGVVLEVTLPCVPQYYVRERCRWRPDLDAVLAGEAGAPMQQFYLMPHAWTYLAHERGVAKENRRAGWAALYRVYWLTFIDVLLHVCVKFCASLMRSRRLVHVLYRRLVPAYIFPRWRVTDRSDRQLLMRHDLFRHLEMEAFVRRGHLAAAVDFVSEVLRLADDEDHELSAAVQSRIDSLCAGAALDALRGSFVHHYPICVRRVRPDDTLISMSSCSGMSEQDWYAISLITLTEPREPFLRVAAFLAETMTPLFGARLHWGKWFPSGVECHYPELGAFKEICEEFDPRGVFRNGFLERTVFGRQPGADQAQGSEPIG
ncbi:MAG: FAD-binding protein [Gemmatimonadetes bacterium]|nr:FAD-binding protein [Gemmatimonadota bacterium]